MPQQLVIVMEDDGRVNVNGPVKDRRIVYAMLEMARDAIFEYHQKNQQRVVEPTPEDLVKLGSGGQD